MLTFHGRRYRCRIGGLSVGSACSAHRKRVLSVASAILFTRRTGVYGRSGRDHAQRRKGRRPLVKFSTGRINSRPRPERDGNRVARGDSPRCSRNRGFNEFAGLIPPRKHRPTTQTAPFSRRVLTAGRFATASVTIAAVRGRRPGNDPRGYRLPVCAPRKCPDLIHRVRRRQVRANLRSPAQASTGEPYRLTKISP